MRRCLNCMREYAEEYENKCPYCGYIHGATHEEGIELMPGTILQNRYIVGTVIRVRDVDVCYRGWDAIFDRQVRIQEYFPRYCATRSGNAQLTVYETKKYRYLEGLELFIHQSQKLIRMYREPDVVTYHACFEENWTAYAIMEARELATLQDRIDEGRINESEAQRLLGQALEAVQKCHEIGVSHGLIDPESFWCTGDGGLILKDFGAWRYVSGEPGIVNYGNPGKETDVYGLAKLFCQMVTGREISDVDMLKRELLTNRMSLSRNTMTAMKHALSRETDTIWQFREELDGHEVREIEKAVVKNHGRLSDLRKWLRIPRNAAVVLIVIVGIILSLTLALKFGFIFGNRGEMEEIVSTDNEVEEVFEDKNEFSEGIETPSDTGVELSENGNDGSNKYDEILKNLGLDFK